MTNTRQACLTASACTAFPTVGVVKIAQNWLSIIILKLQASPIPPSTCITAACIETTALTVVAGPLDSTELSRCDHLLGPTVDGQ
jgi:hypothetical protein